MMAAPAPAALPPTPGARAAPAHPMKIAAWAWSALIPCCAAISAPLPGGLEPAVAASAVGAVRPAAAAVVPACRVDRTDALADGKIRIRAGETLCVRLRLVDGRPEPVALVGGAEAADALVISMSPDRDHTSLTLKNPLPQLLRYRASLRKEAGGPLRYTSSCPVLSNGRMAFEDWPYAIDEFVLSGFELEPEFADSAPRPIVCR